MDTSAFFPGVIVFSCISTSCVPTLFSIDLVRARSLRWLLIFVCLDELLPRAILYLSWFGPLTPFLELYDFPIARSSLRLLYTLEKIVYIDIRRTCPRLAVFAAASIA